MRKALGKNLVGLLVIAMLLMAFVPNLAYAVNGLELEISHEWITESSSYSMADAIGDIDGDGVTEIVTTGYCYNSTLGLYMGELNIWNWNGTSLEEEHKEIFEASETLSSDTRFYGVAIGNVDNETDMEVVVAGYGKFLNIEELGLILVTSWNTTTLNVKTGTYWPEAQNETKFFGLAIGDVDNDGTNEIVTVGYRNSTFLGQGFHGVVTIWNVTGSVMMLETSYEWMTGKETTWKSIAIEDVDGDGVLEIVIAGDFFDNTLGHECALLKICTWDGSSLNWEVSTQWYTYLETYTEDVAIGDLDSDGTPEIITIGYYEGAEGYNAQIRGWSWNGDALTLKTSAEGGLAGPLTSTMGRTVTINDVDNDGKNEVIAGIDVAQFLWSVPTIRIFLWDGTKLTSEDYCNWENATNIQDIATGDVDNDGIVEVVAAGYASPLMSPTSKSLLGIWSVNKVASLITVTLSPASIAIGNRVTISGTVTNETDATPISNAEVTIEYSREPLPVFIYLATVKTNENGEYSYSWIPQATGQYIIRVSWKGDYGHEGASNMAELTVEKASSLIALTLSSYTAKIGDTINVNGTLYPVKATQITIEYTLPNGTITAKTVDSDSAGVFSDTFTANHAGVWNIKASWIGDDTYAETESLPAILRVSKIQSALTISASPLTVNVGGDVTVSGTLTPAQAATVTITYTKPDGTSTTKTVAAAGTGAFTDTIKLDHAGVWQIKASWSGNEQYEATTSISVAVQAVDQTTSILAMAGLGLGVVALILAAIGVMASRKKTAKQPPPTEAPPSTPA
ncbi:MAG: FG-GAP-like repeat-containing protein [Candidatus Bathyarchaeales archaeon]